ncbi:ubiquitin carboxyl-terminal hydrolase 7-like [Zophobas morio]|uniref:ubiquitin carboxyl-terminal hydrolase 7-like n=1 Tax=Zophobas morio TaxID=2755281 RepID=UPI003083AFE4
MKSFIKCIHVDYQSERSESFYDIQLNVKGMKTLYDSFNDYVAIETLDGDNKYRAEGYGLQDAKKGVIFQSFPPVLHLQLKRFEYDLYADQMVKINDRYEFPDHINLDKYLEKKEPGSLGGYTLHAVLVHAGDLNGGHYVVFNKPKIGGDWLKIDDDRVTKVDAKEAIEGNYGSDAAVNTSEVGQLRDPQRLKLKHYSNAYMLVYIRDSCLKEVLCEVSINDVPLHLRARFEREEVEEQRKLRELEEAATLMDVTIITFDNLRNHTSIGIYDFPKSDQPLRVKRSTTIQELYNIVEKLVGLPPQQFRLWKFTSFSDSPSTPSVYLNKAKRSMTLSQHSQYEMKLFVENVMLTSVQDNELLDKILIFFKFYEPLHSQLSIIGYDYISSHSTLLDIIPLFIKMTGLDPQTRFTIFKEECKLARECVTTVTIGRNLRHGDILIFQENIPNNCEFPTAEHYCARLAKHVDVTFKFAGEYCVQQYFKDNKELSTAVKDSYEFSEPFTLNLLADMNYDQVAELVAEHIKFQHPERIRFLSENPITGKPDHAFKRKKLRHETLKTVSDFMSKCRSSRMLSIFFELLDISVSELEAKVLLLINFNGRNHKLLMDPSETVEEATARLLSATGQSEKSPDAYRLLEIKHFQIAHVCDTLTTCGELPLGTDFRLEEIPEDQQELDDERETLVPVCHFHQKPDNLHGQPYLVRLVKGEPLDKTRDRIRKAGGFSEANFSKWRLCVVADGHSKYLDDDSASDVCLYTLVVQSDADFVGLDRPGRSVRLSRPEIPLVIHQ